VADKHHTNTEAGSDLSIIQYSWTQHSAASHQFYSSVVLYRQRVTVAGDLNVSCYHQSTRENV